LPPIAWSSKIISRQLMAMRPRDTQQMPKTAPELNATRRPPFSEVYAAAVVLTLAYVAVIMPI
jgi:hypothetical protein